MKRYTKEEKRAYFAQLRARWNAAKRYAEENQDAIQAIINNHGLNISPINFTIVSNQMKAQGLDGIPYLDVKTFQGWRENGYKVRKGEKSTLSSIVWVSTKSKDEDEEDSGWTFPKATVLFHRSQVEEL